MSARWFVGLRPEPEEIRRARAAVDRFCERVAIGGDFRARVRLAVTEAATNCVLSWSRLAHHRSCRGRRVRLIETRAGYARHHAVLARRWGGDARAVACVDDVSPEPWRGDVSVKVDRLSNSYRQGPGTPEGRRDLCASHSFRRIRRGLAVSGRLRQMCGVRCWAWVGLIVSRGSLS